MPQFPRREYSTRLSRALRRSMTFEEVLMWEVLRRFPAKFRRQEPLGPFIVDFVCFEYRLVVEVDGSQHANNPRDVKRDAYLRSLGFEVLRIDNWDVRTNLRCVAEDIAARVVGPPARQATGNPSMRPRRDSPP